MLISALYTEGMRLHELSEILRPILILLIKVSHASMSGRSDLLALPVPDHHDGPHRDKQGIERQHRMAEIASCPDNQLEDQAPTKLKNTL